MTEVMKVQLIILGLGLTLQMKKLFSKTKMIGWIAEKLKKKTNKQTL